MSTQAEIVKSKLDKLIYEEFIKYHVDNRVFSYREYHDIVMRDADHVKDLMTEIKRKVKLNV
jgi:hypothetical protein